MQCKAKVILKQNSTLVYTSSLTVLTAYWHKQTVIFPAQLRSRDTDSPNFSFLLLFLKFFLKYKDIFCPLLFLTITKITHKSILNLSSSKDITSPREFIKNVLKHKFLVTIQICILKMLKCVSKLLGQGKYPKILLSSVFLTNIAFSSYL